MQFGRMSQAEIGGLIDVYRNAGGNFFDTAHCYCSWLPAGAGCSELALGNYVKVNKCRNRVVIATKGGHPTMPQYRTVTDYLSKGRIEADIDDSLGRLQTDVIDLYWLHRDDPRLEAGSIIEILNAEVRRGRIRFLGASNWTSQRIAEANAYAAARGLLGFAASQPRWSLLQYKSMTQAERLVPGVLLHLDDSDRRWHAQSGLPVICYGSAGKGFFASGGRTPADSVSPENTARFERAAGLAVKLGATPGQVALAWLRAQPFPVIPILGTRSPEHLRDALGTARLSLSPADVAVLERG